MAEGTFARLQRLEAERAAAQASSPREPIQTERIQTESVQPEPIRSELIRSESVQSEPIQGEPVQSEPRPKRTPKPVRSEPIQVTNGFWQLPNTVMDDILPTLQKDDQLVYLRLLRLTWGHRRPTCDVTTAKLGEKTGVKRTAMFAAITRLEARGLVRRVAAKLTGPLDERWNTYEAYIPGVDPPWERPKPQSPSAPNASAPRTDAAGEHMKGNPKDRSKDWTVDRLQTIAVQMIDDARLDGEAKPTAAQIEREIRTTLRRVGAQAGVEFQDPDVIAIATKWGREGD